MNSKTVLLTVALCCLAIAAADPLPRKQLTRVSRARHSVKKPVGTCPIKDGSLPVYLPDADNCEIFYECSGGEPVEKECMAGLCFDTKLNVCAFPPSQKTAEAFRHRSQLPYQDEAAPYDAVGDCPPRDTNVTVYLPDSKNCSLYYVCSNGKPIQNICPPEMAWNSVAHICDWDLDANCKLEIMPFDAVGDCPPRDTNVTVFLPDSKNCSLYYVCSNGKPIQNVCPPEMSWNNVAHICDWDLDANCVPGQSNETVVPYDAVGDCPPRDTNVTVYLPDSKNCSLYYVCSNGKPIQNICPPEMSWNNVAHICDWDLDANCVPELIIAPLTAVGTCPPRDTNVTIFLPDSKNCSVYYICSNGRPLQAGCTPGMSWNTDLNICDWELNVNCTNAPKSARKAVGTCPAVDPPTPIYLPDSDDCSLYYECSGGIPFQNECPPDLEFNPILRVCDFPLDAGCSIPNNSTAPPTDAPTEATVPTEPTTLTT